jgi:hypothetical protein
MYAGSVGPHDQRVVRDGWTYYVQATKFGNRIGRPPVSTSDGSLTGLLLQAAVEAVVDLLGRRRPWTVGVVRFGDVAGWKDRRIAVVHRETLPAGVEPDGLVEELVGRVRSGDFHPVA